MNTIKLLLLLTLEMSACLLLAAEDPAGKLVFYDEETRRYLTLGNGSAGNTRVTVRFAQDPGSLGTWTGQGTRREKELLFARMVGEGEDQGTFFLAEISESKVVVGYKPGTREPQDAGINGTYRRASEAKQQQLLKKEFQEANDRLVAALKAATKTWAPGDRGALAQWKEQWPSMRQRWLELAVPSVPADAGAAKAGRPSPGKPAEQGAAHWLALAQATARGYYFIEWLPDAKTGTGWDGEYDDLGGGHASLRLAKDGKLRVSLSSGRVSDVEASTMDVTVPAEKVLAGKDGGMTAEFVFSDPEAVVKRAPAKVRLTKLGRYLKIETEGAEPYAGRGWFDGIYRGSPAPEG